MKHEPGAVFISVPFGTERDWRTGCHPVGYSTAKADRFCAAFPLEVELRKPEVKGRAFEAVYVGGCGPSLLSLDQLYRLLQSLYDGSIPIEPSEQTLSVLPGAVDEGRAKVLRESGFDRVELRLDADTVHGHDFKVLRQAGFPVVGVELCYPAADGAWEKHLDQVLRLEPDHVTLHVPRGRPASGIALLRSVRAARERLGRHLANYGLHHYCRPGCESRFQLDVWQGRPLLGLGPAAVTRFDAEERCYPDGAAAYEAAVRAGEPPGPTGRAAAAEHARGRLERLEGIELGHANRAAVRELIGHGLLEKRGERAFLTDQGILALDRVAAALARAG